jgi:CRP/FNR family transcriptional regulator, cyclic AMP receptor protein
MAEEKRMLRVLDVDPELGEGLKPDEFREANHRAVAELRTLDPGEWQPRPEEYGVNGSPSGHLGLLLVDGLVLRDVGFKHSTCAELLGAGDLLRPWDEDRRFSTSPLRVRWRTLRPTRLAVLDRRFASIVCHWPSVVEVAMSRSVRRAHRLAFHLALSNLKRVDVRLHVLLWHLADRWGRVRVEGVTLHLPLTHEMLAHLVAAKRPSVTTALGQLSARGVVTRRSDGSWLLHGDPPSEFDDMPRLRDSPGGEASSAAAV